jgi:hypothetical protein
MLEPNSPQKINRYIHIAANYNIIWQNATLSLGSAGYGLIL